MQSFKDAVCGKNIAVVGIGVSNIPLIESALKCGASVTAYDKGLPFENKARHRDFI